MSMSLLFDTETTGLDSEDKIIQVGGISVDNETGKILNIFNELCSCDLPIKIEAMAVHGIRDKQLNGKPIFEDTLFFNELNKYNNENNYLIAHNINFDLGMLHKYGFKEEFKLIDTLKCAKHLFDIDNKIGAYKLPNYKLQTLRFLLLTEEEEKNEEQRYGMKIMPHDAIGDVIILKLVLRKLYLIVKRRFSLTHQEVMGKLVKLTREKVEIKRFLFGKYKKEKISDVVEKDRGYIEWLYNELNRQKENNDSNFDDDLFYTLEKHLTCGYK